MMWIAGVILFAVLFWLARKVEKADEETQQAVFERERERRGERDGYAEFLKEEERKAQSAAPKKE